MLKSSAVILFEFYVKPLCQLITQLSSLNQCITLFKRTIYQPSEHVSTSTPMWRWDSEWLCLKVFSKTCIS